MKASELTQQLSEENTPEREEKLIEFIKAGYYIEPSLIEIESHWNGQTAVLKIMADALMIGEPDDFLRINATMKGEQQIADILSLSLITPKIADLIRLNAQILIEPCTQIPDSRMANTSRMAKHNNDVNNRIMKIKPQIDLPTIASSMYGIVADVGKDWVLTNRLAGNQSMAANYGWHTKVKPVKDGGGPFPCPGGGYMWQPLGTRHNINHVDYSQVVRLMSYEIIVDGVSMQFSDVAQNPKLCGLVSYEGPLSVLRHPQVT